MKPAILAYQRDASVPGVNNITFPELVTWDGKNYTGNILYNDFSTRMASGENLYESGYVVHKIHSYKVSSCWYLHTVELFTVSVAGVGTGSMLCAVPLQLPMHDGTSNLFWCTLRA